MDENELDINTSDELPKDHPYSKAFKDLDPDLALNISKGIDKKAKESSEPQF
jgi:hypothetical protein